MQIHFVPADGTDEVELKGYQDSLALICRACGLVAIDLRTSGPEIRTVPDDKGEDAECLARDGTIPPGSDTCPTCGWSYNENRVDYPR
jgi:hypothetical protein